MKMGPYNLKIARDGPKLGSLLLSDFTKVLEHIAGYVFLTLKLETITFISRPSEKFTTPFQINEDILKVSEKLRGLTLHHQRN